MNHDSPAANEIAAIEIKGLCKRFRNHQALDAVDLQVPTGKVFALLGENGAGKTTLIRILTGFLKADSGTTHVLGHNSAMKSIDIRKQIGYVSDAPSLYEWMTASEIGWFTSSFYDDEFPKRYQQLIADFQVPIDTKISSMSKGQRAKVALALATAHDPQLLILDEPTSGLDPMVRRQFLESMVDRAADGRTVLLSSHLINEVERVADVVAILHSGKIRLIESLDTLKHETRIVTATMDDAHVESPEPRGSVLSQSNSGRQRRWVVGSLAEDWQTDFTSDQGVRHCESTVPSLEEIFIAVCERDETTTVVAS